jgi:hypothetical protein
MDSYLQDGSGNRQYSASNPCVWNYIFRHFVMVIVLWAELWFVVVCLCVK